MRLRNFRDFLKILFSMRQCTRSHYQTVTQACMRLGKQPCEEAGGKWTADCDSREGLGEAAPEWENLDGVTQ